MSLLSIARACRACESANLKQVVSLGQTPLANSLIPAEGGVAAEYPLTLMRCTACGLVQIEEIISPEALFSDYVYFSSNSETLLQHAEAFTNGLIEREHLGPESLAIEIASNDGYLLQYLKRRGVGVLGIEPAANIAEYAEREKGIPSLPRFFGRDLAQELAREGRCADAIIGNNVLAHVPDLNGFVEGVATLLKPTGVASFEVPYVKDMLDKVEFDTIYHEHQCYYSLTALRSLFGRHGLDVADVERLSIHGGTIRVSFAPRGSRTPTARVAALLEEEASWGVTRDEPYTKFAQAVQQLKVELRRMLDQFKADGARIAAYGAAAKGVTLASYCGIGRDDLEFVVDRSPHKQGHRFPVDGVSILAPEALVERKPDYALLFTWNFADEILRQQAAYTAGGGQFIVPVPTPHLAPER
jgi:SAM-dependent methyltransferase